MALIKCAECGSDVSDRAWACPKCGHPVRKCLMSFAGWLWGWEWKSRSNINGIPLVHVAFGWDLEKGTLRVAKGIVAIGQFGIGVITIAQFGIGLLFALGQFAAGMNAVGQYTVTRDMSGM